jgi:hypothetical protein
MTDVYMQEIPENVEATINAINAELRVKREHVQHRIPLPENSLPNATKPGRAILVSDRKIGGPGRDRTDDLFHAMELKNR